MHINCAVATPIEQEMHTYLSGNNWWQVKQMNTGGEGGGKGLRDDGDWKAGDS